MIVIPPGEFRLSEAEYEYATRARGETAYPWGTEIGKNNANCDDGAQREPFTVDSPPAQSTSTD